MNLQTLVSRSISPASSAVLTIGSLHSGSRWNVTSGSAYLEGTVRCFDEETRKTIREGMKRMADRVAAAHGCTAETTYTWLSDAVINDPAITAVAAGAAAEVLGPDGLASVPPTLVGEDFAVIMHRVPSAFGFFGIRNEAVNGTDGLWGAQLDLPRLPWLKKVVTEYLVTRNQSGPFHFIIFDHDKYQGPGGGGDDYYIH